MKKTKRIILTLVFLIFLVLEIKRVFSPFIYEFEPAFQEMIALHHITAGIVSNKFIPVIAEIDNEKFFHTAHPPLLHIIYALFYKIFGAKEWVSRIVSLFFFWTSLFIISRFLSYQERFYFLTICLFLPISFRLALTTNYELLSIFFISLFVFLFERWLKSPSKNSFEIYFVLLLGLLSDWTFYLTIPALFLLHIKQRPARNKLLKLFIIELIFFLLLCFYYWQVAGEVAVFSHSKVRSNPLYLLNSKIYFEFWSHLKWILGLPAIILFLISLIKIITNKSKKLTFNFIWRFWLCFLILLWLSAGQLLTRHFVYLLYLFPFMGLTFSLTINSLKQKNLALLIILLSFFAKDYFGIKHKDARGYYLAEKLAEIKGVKTCFSTSALGTLYFYDKIETVVPVSKKASFALKNINFDLLILDLKSPEVKNLTHFIQNILQNYSLLWSFSDFAVYIKKDLLGNFSYLGCQIDMSGLKNWWESRTEIVWLNNKAYYAIKQPTGWKKISFLQLEAPKGKIIFTPAIMRNIFAGKSDGVNFMIISNTKNQFKLLYARFLNKKPGCPSIISIDSKSKLYFITEAGPRGDYAWDDACWLEAKICRQEKCE